MSIKKLKKFFNVFLTKTIYHYDSPIFITKTKIERGKIMTKTNETLNGMIVSCRDYENEYQEFMKQLSDDGDHSYYEPLLTDGLYRATISDYDLDCDGASGCRLIFSLKIVKRNLEINLTYRSEYLGHNQNIFSVISPEKLVGTEVTFKLTNYYQKGGKVKISDIRQFFGCKDSSKLWTSSENLEKKKKASFFFAVLRELELSTVPKKL